MSHLRPDELEQYVIGAADAEASARLEAHLEGCEACAAALRGEARLELQLFEVAEALDAEAARPATVVRLDQARRRRMTGALWVVGALAAAAALVVVIPIDRPRGVGQEPHINRCSNPQGAADCIARGEFDGVITIGPDRQLIVPRYDSSLPRAQ